jgi:hypothetical protein
MSHSLAKNRIMNTKLTLLPLLTLLGSGLLHAQQDGPRGYLLTPAGTNAAILANVFVDANQTPDQGPVVVDSDIQSFVTLPLYAHPLTITGNVASVFAAQPIGTVDGSVNIGGTTVSNTSSGLGDFAVGAMFGLVGMPALSVEEYVAHQPGFSLAGVIAVSAPTGEYDSGEIFNLGQNRWLFRASLPIVYAMGKSLVDPELTTFELTPAVTFFTPNESPFGANRQTQDPLFQVEAHITRNLNSKVWVSADLGYFYGAEGTTDGVSDDNARMNVNLGGTVGVSINASMQMQLSYSHSIINNDFGMDGQGVRLMLIAAF